MDTTPQSTFPELEQSQTGLNTLTALDPLENANLQTNNLGALNSDAIVLEPLNSTSTNPQDTLIPNNPQSTDIPNPIDTELTGNIDTLVGEVTPDTRDSLFADNTGIFTVDDSGEISVDFLFDGGWFKGELAIFSLEGLENLDPHSQEFKQTAVNRALSNSDLGHILISDETEGARFDGALGDGHFNAGDYAGVKTVEMLPGTEFGFLFVSHGNVAQVAENPRKGVKFSMTTPEASRSFNGQQFTDITGDGHTFGIEDLSIEGSSDRDYNDIIFQLQGATGSVADLDSLIDPEKDWRDSSLAQEIVQIAVEPVDLAGNTPDEALVTFPSTDGNLNRGWVGTSDSEDYYAFTLGTRNEFNLSLSDLWANVDVELLDLNGNVLYSSTNPGTESEELSGTLEAGAYRVKISNASETGTPYSFKLGIKPTLEGITTTASDAPIATSDHQSMPLIGLDDFQSGNTFRNSRPEYRGIDGSGFSTVILDTGINLSHPAFGPDNNNDGISDRIILDPNAAFDFSDADDDPTDDADPENPGHGSNVASIAAGDDPNGNFTGVATGANIIPLKVFGQNNTFQPVEQALQWVVNSVENGNPFNIASVNMSLSVIDSNRISFNYSTETNRDDLGINDELARLADLGVIVVSSAGNDFFELDSQPGVAYPAADPNSLAIGATYDTNVGDMWWDKNENGEVEEDIDIIAWTTEPDRIVPISQRHPELIDVFAPGSIITGAGVNSNPASGSENYFTNKTGTSMAAPHVAGMAVLAQQLAQQELGRQLTPNEFRRLLNSTGVPIFDGDDEDDNVTNTQTGYRRADMLALADGIMGLEQAVDLSASYFNVSPDNPDTGDWITANFRVDNSQAKSSGSFDVDFYISDNETISTFDHYLGSYTVSNVPGNDSTGTLRKSLRLPDWENSFWDGNVNGSDFYVGMIVDADDDVNETNESNNRNTGFLDSYDDISVGEILVGAYSYSSSFSNFTQQISDRWDDGFEMIAVERGGGRWFGIFGEDTRSNAYSFHGNFDSFQQQISDRWDEGLDLIDVEYGDGRWFGVFSRDSGRNAYSSHGNFDSFQQQIRDRWNQGYELIDVGYGNGRWFGVFSDDTRPNAWASAGRLNDFEQQISDKWDEGLDLIDVEYGDGRWFGVFGRDEGPNAWAHATDFDDFQQQISDKWDEGFELVDVGYGDGRWFGVFQD